MVVGMFLAKAVVFLLSLGLVVVTLRSALRTLVVPRGMADAITGATFLAMRQVFNFRLRFARTYEQHDAVMAYYAPVATLLLLPVWLGLMLVAYAGLFWATGVESWYDAFVLSGSSLLTLGFASDNTFFHMVLAFSEATIGLILVALLIAYLPTIYSAFSTRESAVAQLDVRAGSPPSVYDFILRAHRIGKLTDLQPFFHDWEILFSQIEESHTSLPTLIFLRSPDPRRSWITAAGNVLDTAAFLRSSVDVPPEPQADLCIRAGYLALRRITSFFAIPFNADPRFPADPISITRAEYDAVCNALLAQGVPLKPDREQAWLDFAGWRVNYDGPLLALCSVTMAPPAPWSSDRAPESHLTPIQRRMLKHKQG